MTRAKPDGGLVLVIALLLGCGCAGSAKAAEVSFPKDVFPILEQNCFQCHGDAQKSGLDLRSRDAALKGGQRGAAIVPGNAAASRLLRRVSGHEKPSMPLGGSLSETEIDVLRAWIDQGAPWDLEAPAKRDISTPSGPGSGNPQESVITEADRQWWAFQKPLRPAVPDVRDRRWNSHPVDAFVGRQLGERGLRPAPPADKQTLIRRAYLDLIGLLPTPEEVNAFVSDPSPKAFEGVVDRLLASPHYGERWGRHWMDVARYGDSGGYEYDYEYRNAWRYRDYVIRAFNEDKPYDQFVLEQLAGDELDEVTFDGLIATGFHRVGPRVGFREKDNPQLRYEYLDDMIGTTSRAFMALTVQCARCHDHKFDPIPQTDYYRMMAGFFSYIDYDFPLATPDEIAAYETTKAEVDARIKTFQDRIAELREPYEKIVIEKQLEELDEGIRIAVRTPESERTPGQKLLAAQVLSISPKEVEVKKLFSPEDREKYAQIKDEMYVVMGELPKRLPLAAGIRDGDYRFAPPGPGDEDLPGKGNPEVYDVEGTYVPEPGKRYQPPPAYFLRAGNHLEKGPEVKPGFLQVITMGNPPTERPPSNGRITTGRRRALAEWLVSEDHPLTARVMVNRLWQHHFTNGIVATASNFGRSGRLPTHPELLDWLATEFIRRDWSIKQMHRLIMTSQVYQMSSAFYLDSNNEADPENLYLWRFPEHRLEGEIIRDIILESAGNLNTTMHGKAFFPPLPEDVVNANARGRWKVTKPGPEVWRRSIYSYWRRAMSYPMFEVFDLPSLNSSCERRGTTTVPTQALTLMNSEFVTLQSKRFAERLRKEAGSDRSLRIRRAYRVALSRDPSPEEFERTVEFVGSQEDYHAGRAVEDPNLEALTDLCSVLLNLNEFVYVN